MTVRDLKQCLMCPCHVIKEKLQYGVGEKVYKLYFVYINAGVQRFTKRIFDTFLEGGGGAHIC